MMYYYNGMNRWAKETNSIVDIFTCYGRPEMDSPHDQGEYGIFEFPDLEEYDGAIMIASNINEESVRKRLENRIREAKLPCVVLDYEIEGFSRIYIDQEYYINQMVHHLVEEHNVKKLAYIGGLATNVEGAARLAGFQSGIKECGLTVQEDWFFSKRFRFNDGVDVANHLLKQEKDFPEAIVCANDEMAAGVCEALQLAGVSVGEDCLVTGFDQYFFGENYAPSLTTVRRPRESIAYHACCMLENYDGPRAQKESANLSFGQSCGCGINHLKNDTAFRRYVFNTFNYRDVFSSMVAHMEERMISGNSIDDIVESMEDAFSRFKNGRCCVRLQPNVETQPKSTYNTYRTCTRKYLLWERGDDGEKGETGHAYIYAPIHFLDHLYGVCIFRDIPQFFNNKELYNFTKSIGFSLENVVQKKKYALVNDKLEYLYETDYLTGTFNRHGYARYAGKMLQKCRQNNKSLLISFVDVDGLKTINDQYGHEAGDVVIRLVGQCLNELADEKTKVFRYGGDEFLLLREWDSSLEVYNGKINELIQLRSSVLQLPYKVGASVGWVIATPDDKKELDDYVKEADTIMYDIKQRRHRGEQIG